MKIGSYRTDGGARLVAVAGDGTYRDVGDLVGREGPVATDLRAFIAEGPALLADLSAALARGGAGRTYAADERRLGPPVAAPRRILCVGYNYGAHAAETHAAVPTVPEIFLKVPSTLIGPRDDLWLPQESDQLDLEVELGLVIGAGGRRIPKEEALSRVFGFTVMNDGSVRDFQKRTTQFTAGKNFEHTCPSGPFVVTRDEAPDPSAFHLSSRIDDQPMQDGHASDMIFDVAAIVSDLSTFTSLEPGDLIATGTPPGVGEGRVPPRFCRAGETVYCTIDGLGELANRVVADPTARRV